MVPTGPEHGPLALALVVGNTSPWCLGKAAEALPFLPFDNPYHPLARDPLYLYTSHTCRPPANDKHLGWSYGKWKLFLLATRRAILQVCKVGRYRYLVDRVSGRS